MKVAIFYYNFLDANGENYSIGGIQSYLIQLIKLLKTKGFSITLYQRALCDFEKELSNCKVVGVDCSNIKPGKLKYKMVEKALKSHDLKNDIFIFGSDRLSVKLKSSKTISIQHGIAWDLPIQYLTKRKIIKNNKTLEKIFRAYIRYSAISKFNKAKYRVCVDYNFLNWIHTYFPDSSEKTIWVIPNFSEIPDSGLIDKRKFDKENLKILFARRFFEYRGTKLFSDVVDELLNKYTNVQVTFAGEGTDEEWLKNKYYRNSKVKFTKFSPSESIQVHFNHDISVVPSLASEGTSLSVIEAMASGCPVIATAAGGITNVIIDRFNGLLIRPYKDELLKSIELLITNQDLREKYGINGFLTVESSFSIDNWRNKWLDLIEHVVKYS